MCICPLGQIHTPCECICPLGQIHSHTSICICPLGQMQMRRTRFWSYGPKACAISASVCPLGQTLALRVHLPFRANAHAGLPNQEAPKGPLDLAITNALLEQRYSALKQSTIKVALNVRARARHLQRKCPTKADESRFAPIYPHFHRKSPPAWLP